MKNLYLIVVMIALVGCGSESREDNKEVVVDNNKTQIVSTTPSPNIEDSSKKPPSIPDI